MKLAKLVIAVALCNLFALGQIVNNKGTKEQDTFIQTVSGSPVIMYDGIGTQTNQFEIIPTGGPATVSVVIVGCMRSGTCSATLTSTTSTTSILLSVTGGPYDYYQITPSWTGGSSPTIKINRTGTAARSNNGGAAASVPFSGITSGINTSAQMQVGGTAALSPLNLGQVAGSQVWLQPGLITPVVTAGATSSGTLNATHSTVVEVTYNTSLGETLPSMFVQTSNAAAGCASLCSIIITVPTLASGYTGYTVYTCDVSSGVYPSTPCNTPATLQRVTSCTNISTNCTITTIPGVTASVPLINTSIIQPSNIQNATLVPLSGIPTMYLPRADGTVVPLAGVDFSNNGVLPTPDGTFTIWHRLFINDTGFNIAQNAGANGPMKNNLVSIAHLMNGNTTGQAVTNDDRALGIKVTLPTTTSGNVPREMGIYEETWVQGNPTLGTCPDCGAVGGRFTVADNRSGGVVGSGIGAVAGSYQYQTGALGTFGSCDPCAYGLKGEMSVGNATTNLGSLLFAGVWSTISSSASVSGEQLVSYYAAGPTVGGHLGSIAYLQRNGGGTWPTGASDYFLRSDVSGSQSIFGGTLNLPAIVSDATTIPVNGSITDTGAITTAQASIPIGTATCGTAGATNFVMKLVGKDAAGGTATSANINYTCAADVTAVNTLKLQISAPTVAFTSYDFYLTSAGGTCNGGACTLGKVGSCTPIFQATQRVGTCTSIFAYTGAAGDGTTVPSVNTIGAISAAGDFSFNNGKGQHFNTQAANNDYAGTCTAAAATTCTVTFTRAYTAAPVCVATDATNITTLKVTPSTSSLIITTSGASSDVFDYNCTGNPN